MKKHRIRGTGVPVKLAGNPVLYAGEFWQVAVTCGPPSSQQPALYRASDLEEYNEPPDEIFYDAAGECLRARGGKLTDDDMEEIVQRYNSFGIIGINGGASS